MDVASPGTDGDAPEQSQAVWRGCQTTSRRGSILRSEFRGPELVVLSGGPGQSSPKHIED